MRTLATSRARRAFTLIELLVAIACFSLLGLMLVSMLRTSMDAWRRGEAQREMYESTRVVSDQLAQDLEHIFSNKSRRDVRPDLVLLCQRAADGRQRLVLVRTLGPEARNARAWQAGDGTVAEGYDAFYDGKAGQDKLRALGGLGEVFYALHPDADKPWLMRGLRAPIGLGGTIWNQLADADGPTLEAACQVISSDVVYLGFEFWGADGEGGGTWYDSWDSTRGLIEDFPLYSEGSDSDASDDVWPWKIRATVTIRGVARPVVLRKPVESGDMSIAVNTTEGLPDPAQEGQGFVRIGGEWIEVASLGGSVIRVKARGVRGTVAQRHTVLTTTPLPGGGTVEDPTPVLFGRTFTIVRALPMIGRRGH